MIIISHAPAKHLSTMRLGGRVRWKTTVRSLVALRAALNWANQRDVPVIIIGHGSNTLWSDDEWPGLVIINRLKGISFKKQTDGSWLVRARAGEEWDDVVAISVEHKLTGIEALSKIPGTVGAAPVQNIGAYGQSLSDTIESVEVIELASRKTRIFNRADCHFGYRQSRFNTNDAGKYVIIAIALRLHTGAIKLPLYQSLQSALDDAGNTMRDSATIRRLVTKIRQNKLPDPSVVPNCGSFFKNPIVSQNKANSLIKSYPNIIVWPVERGVKISAGWLIDEVLNGRALPNNYIQPWSKQRLVLTNHGATKNQQLTEVYQLIQGLVQTEFGISLEIEPNLIGSKSVD